MDIIYVKSLSVIDDGPGVGPGRAKLVVVGEVDEVRMLADCVIEGAGGSEG